MRIHLWVPALVAAGTMVLAGTGFARDFTFGTKDITGGSMTDDYAFNGNGCTGKNISPQLDWKGEPKETKSFAVTVEDSEKKDNNKWQWVVFNIPGKKDRLTRGAGDPKGGKIDASAVQTKNRFGTYGYGGPCPNKGDVSHRYLFTLYALNVDKLNGTPDSDPDAMVKEILAHTLLKVSFPARYGH